MQKILTSLGLLTVGAIAIAGCKSGTDSPTAAPTTMTAPPTNGTITGPTTMPVPSAHQTEIIVPASKPPAAKDLTHVLTKDEPFYLNEPGSTPVPVGTLKAGSKVLLMSPGSEYSQVITDTGISAYTMTDGLKPLGK